MKILNLYAGIGGNRKLWGDEHEITAVELRPEIADVYHDFFPNDRVIVGDAHQYLQDHYAEFDFIWTSPPCQSHSTLRGRTCVARGQSKPIYSDAKLWQEIIFLKTYCKKDFVVENVIPYYKPLIAPDFKIQRHLFWSNKFILSTNFEKDNIDRGNVRIWQNNTGFDLSNYQFSRKSGLRKAQILKNCVRPELGLYIFQQITGQREKLR